MVVSGPAPLCASLFEPVLEYHVREGVGGGDGFTIDA
jgi:hypothetical protein